LGPLKVELEIDKINPLYFADLVESLNKNEISATVAKQIILESYRTDKHPIEIAKDKNLLQISNTGELEKFAKQVISNNQKAVDDYHKNPNSIGFLVGQVMKASGGTANPTMVKEILEKFLK